MTKIYFSYTFGLRPQFLAHSSRNPRNFLSNVSHKDVFCYVNEMTFEPVWGGGGGGEKEYGTGFPREPTK